MGVRLSVEDVVGVVGKTLASIDVRTASVFIDSKWQNVMTVVRMVADSPNILSGRVLDTFSRILSNELCYLSIQCAFYDVPAVKEITYPDNNDEQTRQRKYGRECQRCTQL